MLRSSFSKRLNTLREQVGQLLIMGFDEAEPSAKLRSTLATLQPGGVILFARNIQHPAQTWHLLHECEQIVNTPLFRCVDLEGGMVDRLRNAIAPVPSAADVFATRDRKAFRRAGQVIGEECRALGFNVDFAPVSDLGLEPSRSVLTSRTVSADPKETATFVREFLRGLKDAEVLGCGKHFPGLGEGEFDSHKGLPVIRKPLKRMWEEDLYPYRDLKKDFPFVMVAHAAYPDVTNDQQPASLSKKWITDILRKKIGFKNLVITDDLDMGGVQAAASVGDAAVQTLKAGADMFMVCNSEEHVWRAYHMVLSEADRDRRFATLVAERAQRVLDYKRKSAALKRMAPRPTQKIVDKLQRAIWELNEEVRLEQVAAGAQQ